MEHTDKGSEIKIGDMDAYISGDAATAKAVVQRAVSCTGVLGEPVQAGAASTSGGSQSDSKPQGWMEKFLLHCKSECLVNMVVVVVGCVCLCMQAA